MSQSLDNERATGSASMIAIWEVLRDGHDKINAEERWNAFCELKKRIDTGESYWQRPYNVRS